MAAQLPTAWYTDPAFYALEQQHLFSQAPRYIGHTLMAPNPGDYHTLDWLQAAKVLVHDQQGHRLLSNVCRHRQAIMLKGQGSTQHIVCPLHRWTYNLQGELLGAPHFAENPCLHLNSSSLQEWNGLLFDTERNLTQRNVAKELEKIACKQHFDFTGYQLDRVKIEEYSVNWKTFIEVYLEDYHVGPFHPGLGQFVDCEHLAWEFGSHYSIQNVGVKHGLEKAGSPIYQRWQHALLAYSQNNPVDLNKPSPASRDHRNAHTAGNSNKDSNAATLKHGAIWMVYYPFLMLEWYPHVLVVSHIIPRGVDACTNVVEFYYPEDIALFEREFVAAHQAAYEETALEDKEICQRMHDGRRALHSLGLDERGPYQHPLESGLEHFHLWLRQQLSQHL